MEWGEEEGAQQEQVVRLEAHAPLLQQSSPDLRRRAREAAATSPPGQDAHLLLCRIPDNSRWGAAGKSAVIIAIRHGTSALLLKGMRDDALIGLLHVTPKPHLATSDQPILDLRRAQESFIPPVK